jgi:hypothetical protein
MQSVITNDVSDSYQKVYVITHIICNHPLCCIEVHIQVFETLCIYFWLIVNILKFVHTLQK